MKLAAPLTSFLKRCQILILTISLLISLTAPAIAAPIDGVGSPEGESSRAELASLEDVAFPMDLNKAILMAEAASNAIFNGLETTQDFIGKTERRKEAIEHGRNHASDRLKALIERARAAESYRDLSPIDRLVLKRLLGNS